MKLPDSEVGARLHAASNAAITAGDIKWGAAHEAHVFTRLGEGHYRLEVPEASAVFDVDRLSRDRQRDLTGEIAITCDLKGAKAYDGTIFSGHINLSDAFRRREVCSKLKGRAQTGSQVDWEGLVDEFCVRIVRAEREGKPAKLLTTFDRPAPDESFALEGLSLPRRHPSILFGDGGSAKSYLGLFIAGNLAQQGVRVLYADWELEGEDHRDRLERLFGADMPAVYYLRLHRPMVDEVDGIKRQIDDLHIDYIICDSVGYATAGAPESAEAAMAYFRAVRQIGIGSLHLAHVVKAQEDQKDPTRPFGSTFWHNSARSTWFIKRTTDTGDSARFTIALYNRKTNLGPLRPPMALEVVFDPDRTFFTKVNLADVDELAGSLPVWQRMKRALESGPPLTFTRLADELGATDDTREKLIETMAREVRRKTRVFTKLTDTPDGVQRIALVSSRREGAA